MKNYYVVLGVPRTATSAGIRSAYRTLAKRYHPDVASDAAAESFRDIAEAYRVLSDPDRRDAHDRELDASTSRPVRPVRPMRPAAVVEPLIPEPRARPEPLRGQSVRTTGAIRCPRCGGTGLVSEIFR